MSSSTSPDRAQERQKMARKSKLGLLGLLGMLFLLLVVPTRVSAWQPPATNASGGVCVNGVRSPITWIVTNVENGFEGSPATIEDVVISPALPISEFAPQPIPNTGDSKAYAKTDVPADFAGTVSLEYTMVWRGSDGSDERAGSAQVTVEKCVGPPTTTTTITFKQIGAKGLCDHSIDVTEWHFVITGIADVDAPASINVKWGNGDTEVVPLDKVTGNVAHYATTSNLDSYVTGATASIVTGWDGQFNLSHGPSCVPATTTSSSTSTSTSTTSTSTTSTSTTSTSTSTTQPETTTTTAPETTTTTGQVTTTTAEETTSTTAPSTTVPAPAPPRSAPPVATPRFTG